MKISEIKTSPPFDRLWPADSTKVDVIAESIRKDGFDMAEPVIVWNDLLIDGHTRFQAAKLAGLTDVPVSTKSFQSEKEALQYAIHRQRDRRNLSDADLFSCIEELDNRKKSGAPKGNNNASKTSGASEPVVSKKSSAEKTAATVGTSSTKVKKARAIQDHADPETKKAVKSGKKSINAGYQETQQKRKQTKGKKALTKKAKNHDHMNKEQTETRLSNTIQQISKDDSEEIQMSPAFRSAFEKFVGEVRKAEKSNFNETSQRAIKTCVAVFFSMISCGVDATLNTDAAKEILSI